MRGFVASLVALLVAIVVVHLFYAGIVTPQSQQALADAAAQGQSAPRDFFVIIKDVEQQICITLMLWGIYLMAVKGFSLLSERYLFDVDFMQSLKTSEAEGTDFGPQLSGAGPRPEASQSDPPNAAVPAVDPEDTHGLLRLLESELEKSRVHQAPLVQTWLSCIRRYVHTNDIQNASDALAASVESLAVRMESENSMIRYLIWAIPSIGFIGTVRGIGQALAQADAALAGDIAGMVDGLGIAFNSTLVALFISIILMFLFHQLQRLQDGMVIDTQAHCEKYLLKHLH